MNMVKNGYKAIGHEQTGKFMLELRELMVKWQLAIVPSYEDRVSFHDPMFVVPLDDDTMKFVMQHSLFEVEEPEELDECPET